MAVVVGLGNPGRRYARTRHNAGWRVVERLAGAWRAVPAESDPAWYRSWRAERGGREAWLVQPLGYMNVSGEALGAFRARRPFEVAELLVVSDDVYLPLGVLRLRARGSSGGHRGLESVETALGGPVYDRLRIGVGAAESAAALREHVLEEFADDERSAAEDAVRLAADAVECWREQGILAAMNRFNRRVRQEESEP